MARRAPRIEAMQHMTLPPGAPSRWGVRTPPNPAALCTYEAATRLVEVLHGVSAAAPMHEFFAELSARMLGMRGRSPVDASDSSDISEFSDSSDSDSED
jgi:DTW domain-containing protein YfiP